MFAGVTLLDWFAYRKKKKTKTQITFVCVQSTWAPFILFYSILSAKVEIDQQVQFSTCPVMS